MQTHLSETIEFNGMSLDVAGHSLLDEAGRDVKLTRGEFAILTALLRRPGQVLSRDQLLDAVSGRGADAFDRSIDNLVSRLRRKIEPDPRTPRLIVSVRGAGYKFSLRPDAGKALSPARAVSRCSILVAPFANLSGGRELSHFAAAVSTNLTSGLRHVVGAEPVCAADATAGVHRSGQAGTHYILRGWVRRSRRQIRLDAQMIDAWTGASVWAERFDGKFADMLALEGEISARIARGIDLELVIAESRNGPDRAGDLNIQDLLTRGYADLYRPRTARNLATARIQRCANGWRGIPAGRSTSPRPLDEAGTLSRLNALRRELIDPAIAAHSGRVVKLMGDGALVEFASAVDAVTCAIEIQRLLRDHDASRSEADPMLFRIGINVGDIIIAGDDILGDGVNVAARIEGTAEPGGVSISEDAWRQVQGKVTANFVDAGE